MYEQSSQPPSAGFGVHWGSVMTMDRGGTCSSNVNASAMEEHDTLVYRYGLLAPLNWDKDCHHHLWLQNQLWNRLVEIERDVRENYRRIVGEHADVGPTETKLKALRERQSVLRVERKQLRKAWGGKSAESEASLMEQLRQVAREMQPLAQRLKEARRVVRHDLAEPLAVLERERLERVEKARKESGLWWANSNAITDAYVKARSKVMREAGQLQFHTFRGEGRFTVQLIGGRTVEKVMAGQCSHLRIDGPQAIPERSGRARPQLSIAIYTREHKPRLLTFPLIDHRPLPERATVQDVTVTRRCLGTRFRYHVAFRLRVDARPFARHAHPERRCAINLGFRQRPDGALRVGMLVDERGASRELILPADVLSKLDRLSESQSRRGIDFNRIVAALRAQWAERPERTPPELQECMVALLSAPRFRPAKLAAVVLLWRVHPACQDYFPTLRDALESWRHADKLSYEFEANGRDYILTRRLEYYRDMVRQLAKEFGEIRIGEIDLKRLKRLESPCGEENELHLRARRNRDRAALYELQSELAKQAQKSGTVLIRVARPYATVCYHCAQSIARDSDRSDLMVSCPQGHVWDQDELAALNIFAASRERFRAVESPEERSRRRTQALTRMRERLARMATSRKARRSQRSSKPAVSTGI